MLKFKNIKIKAFTLVEIMIGVAIFALLFILFNEFMSHSRRQAENLFQKGDNLREARLALQFFEFDIRNSEEIINFEETDNDITMTLKHIKEVKNNIDPLTNDTITYDYIVYTFYLKDQGNIKAFSLYRAQSNEVPNNLKAGTMPNNKLLLKSFKDNLTGNTIGILKEYEFPVVGVGVVKRESKFFAIDNNYYINVMLDDSITLDKKEEMIAKATYKGKYNGTEVGFKDIKNAIGVWLQFIITDNNKNINFFDQIVYLRCKK